MFIESFKGGSRKFKWFFKEISRVFQGSFKSVLSKLRGKRLFSLIMLQGCFK